MPRRALPQSLIRSSLILAAAALTVAGTAAAAGAASAAPAAPAAPQARHQAAAAHHAVIRPATRRAGEPDFGPDVYVFTPSMPQSQIQATVDAIASQQVSNQFGTQRYALLFEPGTYGSAADPLNFQVGYYTEVAGLGAAPGDVTVNGTIDVYNQCFAANNCIALDNFWRSLSNLTINVTGSPAARPAPTSGPCRQAAPMRRVAVTGGNLSLMDYCTAGPQFASGGFIADSAFSGGTVVNGSQQQFVVRNSDLDGWSNGVWNQVFAGDTGAPPQAFGVTGGPALHHPGHQPGDRGGAVPADRRGRELQRVRARRAATTPSGTTWSATASTPGRSDPDRPVLHRLAGHSGGRDQPGAGAAART